MGNWREKDDLDLTDEDFEDMRALATHVDLSPVPTSPIPETTPFRPPHSSFAAASGKRPTLRWESAQLPAFGAGRG